MRTGKSREICGCSVVVSAYMCLMKSGESGKSGKGAVVQKDKRRTEPMFELYRLQAVLYLVYSEIGSLCSCGSVKIWCAAVF